MNVNADEKGDFYAPSDAAVKNPVLDSNAVPGTPAHEMPNPVEAPGDAIIHELPGKVCKICDQNLMPDADKTRHGCCRGTTREGTKNSHYQR
jgi:hypothetical protein